MNITYKIIYKKRNGEIIERIRNTKPFYYIGEETSMGWTLVNVLYEYENEFYDFQEYCKIKRENHEKKSNRLSIRNMVKLTIERWEKKWQITQP